MNSMSKITVKFDKTESIKTPKPSGMPICQPFIVVKDSGEKYVAIKTSYDAFIFFDIDGDITCTDDNSARWADSTFSVLNESATLTIEV